MKNKQERIYLPTEVLIFETSVCKRGSSTVLLIKHYVFVHGNGLSWKNLQCAFRIREILAKLNTGKYLGI